MYRLPLSTRHRILSKVGILALSIVPDTNSRSKPDNPVSPGRLPYSAACSRSGAVPSPSSNEVLISVCRCSAYAISSCRLIGPLLATTHLVEETCSLPQNPAFLLQLSLSLSQFLPRSIHIRQPPFMLLKLIFQLVIRVLRTRTDGREGRNGGKRRDAKCGSESGDLRMKESETSGRFGETTESRGEGALKGSNSRIQLRTASA